MQYETGKQYEVILPGCCGKKMTVVGVYGKFIEVLCPTCRDVAYIKRRVEM